MKKFCFRLQKLLDLETQREEQEKLQLQSLVNNLQGNEMVLNHLQVSLRQNQDDLTGKKIKSLDLQKITIFQNYISALNTKIEFQERKVNSIVEEVDKKRKDLIGIKKSRKMLEKLRIKDKSVYTSTNRKSEIKQLDDISGYRRYTA